MTATEPNQTTSGKITNIMSKQSEAKIKQGYVPKAIPQTCVNCASFRLDVATLPTGCGNGTYRKETNLRCCIGGFAVKKMGTCNEFSGKP